MIGVACLSLAGGAYWLSPLGGIFGIPIMLAVAGAMCLFQASVVPFDHFPAGQVGIQAGGAVSWGVFFSVMPIAEAILLGSIIWIPLLITTERRRARRYGFLPGAGLRVVIIALIMVAASLAPLKYQDREIGPLSSTEMTFEALGEEMRPHGWRLNSPNSLSNQLVSFPSRSLSVRQIVESIESQTALEARIPVCATDMSVLWGGYPLGWEIWLRTKDTE